MMNFKRPVCRGSKVLGTACGKCERCKQDPYDNNQANAQDIIYVRKGHPFWYETPSQADGLETSYTRTALVNAIRAERDELRERVKALIEVEEVLKRCAGHTSRTEKILKAECNDALATIERLRNGGK